MRGPLNRGPLEIPTIPGLGPRSAAALPRRGHGGVQEGEAAREHQGLHLAALCVCLGIMIHIYIYIYISYIYIYI